MSSKSFQKLVLEAYGVKDALRPKLAKYPWFPVHAGAVLVEQLNYDHLTETDADAALLETLPYEQVRQINLARRLGVGVLIAEYLQRRTDRTFDLWATPLVTPFSQSADRTIHAMDQTQPADARALDELDADIYQLAQLIGQFHEVLALQQAAGAMHLHVFSWERPVPALPANHAAPTGVQTVSLTTA